MLINVNMFRFKNDKLSFKCFFQQLAEFSNIEIKIKMFITFYFNVQTVGN